MKYNIYTEGNYFTIKSEVDEYFYGHRKDVIVDKDNINLKNYRVFNVKDFSDKIILKVGSILKLDNSLYTQVEWETFYKDNTGNFNGGGTAPTNQNLQQVTDVGNTTTNPIVVQGIKITSGVENERIKITDVNSTAIQIGNGPFNTNNINLGGVQIGTNSSVSNTGTDCIQIGIETGTNNAGADCVQIGNYSSNQNTGSSCVQIGNDTGLNNVGGDNIQIGTSVGGSNNSIYTIQLGQSTGQLNSGDNSIQIGTSTGFQNSGDNVVQIGNYSGKFNIFNNVIQIISANQPIKTAAATQDNQAVLQATQGRLLIDLSSLADNTLSGTNTGDNSLNLLYENKIQRVIISSQSGNVVALSAPNTDYVYIFTATGTLTLPTAIANKNRYTVKNRSAVNITVNFTSGQNADGSISIAITPNQALEFISDNNNYIII